MVKDDEPAEATFTYSVQWRETDTPYEKRMDKYRRYQFLPQHLEVDCLISASCERTLWMQPPWIPKGHSPASGSLRCRRLLGFTRLCAAACRDSCSFVSVSALEGCMAFDSLRHV